MSGLIGGRVVDQTGLDGRYRFRLRYSRPNQPSADDAPDIATALREQLGLRLVSTKTMINVLVVDRLERPAPD